MIKKILIVDSEKETRNFLKRTALSQYELILTDNALQALSFLDHALDISLVLISALALSEHGFKILKKIKTQKPNTKVIILAESKTDEIISHALRLGVDGCLRKPLRKKEILETLNTFLTHP